MEPIVITINCMFVGEGGNTQDAMYVYSAVPKMIHVTKHNQPIQFRLSPDTAEKFSIHGYYTSDTKQIESDLVPNDFRDNYWNVTHRNEVASLTFFSLVLKDKSTNKGREGNLVNCDPQATNVPEPPR